MMPKATDISQKQFGSRRLRRARDAPARVKRAILNIALGCSAASDGVDVVQCSEEAAGG
jgi:hypothetical protein